jgi:hypothetical protein
MSDYTKTKRKILPNLQTQYVLGGSRHDVDNNREDPVSKVGVLSNADIASAMVNLPPEISRKNYKAMIEQGLIDLDELKAQGLKFQYEDEVNDDVTYVYYGNKKYPKSSKLFPGDIVELYFPEDKRKHKLLATVVHVRNFHDWTISAYIREGEYTGSKMVLTVDQYRVVRRLDGGLAHNDYVAKVRTNILKEDADNIDKI